MIRVNFEQIVDLCMYHERVMAAVRRVVQDQGEDGVDLEVRMAKLGELRRTAQAVVDGYGGIVDIGG